MTRHNRRETELRSQLQACQSRCRLARQALGYLRERLMAFAIERLTLEHLDELGEIAQRFDHIDALLGGEVEL